MAVFFNGQTGYPSRFDHSPLLRLCHDLDHVMMDMGIDGCVCFDNEAIRPGLLEHISNNHYDVYVVVQTEFNFITKFSPTGVMDSTYAAYKHQLNELAKDRVIILAAAQNNDSLDGLVLDNLHNIWIPGAAMLTDYDNWLKISPIKEKNFGSSRHWVSLNNGQHHHRNMMAMILLGHGLGLNQEQSLDTGSLNISAHRIKTFDSWKQYWGSPLPQVSPQHDEILRIGFDKLINEANGGQPDGDFLLANEAMLSAPNNFDRCLRHLYSDSVIEFINDTTFYNPAGTTHNEKYINAVMGMHMPLMVSNTGAVHEFRGLGFDVFDDVLDHSYDAIVDPVSRMFAIVESNLALLENGDLARHCWMTNVERMLDNINHLYKLPRIITNFAQRNLNQQLVQIGL